MAYTSATLDTFRSSIMRKANLIPGQMKLATIYNGLAAIYPANGITNQVSQVLTSTYGGPELANYLQNTSIIVVTGQGAPPRNRHLLEDTNGYITVIVDAGNALNTDQLKDQLRAIDQIQQFFLNVLASQGVSYSIGLQAPAFYGPSPMTAAVTSLLEADIDSSSDMVLAEEATSSNIRSLLVNAGMPASTQVIMLANPELISISNSPPPSPVPPAPAGGGGGPPSWVWILVGIGLAAVVGGGFVFFLIKKRMRRSPSVDVVGVRYEQSASRKRSVQEEDGKIDVYASIDALTQQQQRNRGSASSHGPSEETRTAEILVIEQQEQMEDQNPIGSVEIEIASPPMIGLPIIQVFTSDRQKAEPDLEHETGSLMTRIIAQRTAHLTPGAAFLGGRIRLVEGVSWGATFVIRNGIEMSSGRPVSIKFYSKMADFMREKAFLEMPEVDHKHVAPLVAVGNGDEQLPPFSVTLRGDFTLADVLRKSSRPPVQQQRIILYDIAAALAHIHSLGAVHMDVNTSTVVFFGVEGRWKLTGFENWASIGESADILYCLSYSAPEVVRADILGDAALLAMPGMDCWSLGVMAYEILSGERFFKNFSDQMVMQALLGYKLLPSEGENPVLAKVTDANANRLVRHLLRRSEEKRWSSRKASECAYFKVSDFEAYRVTS